MGAGRAHDLVVVAEDLEAAEPPVEEFPVGEELDDVLADDHVVAVDFGRGDDVERGGPCALEAGLDRVAELVQVDLFAVRADDAHLSVHPLPAAGR